MYYVYEHIHIPNQEPQQLNNNLMYPNLVFMNSFHSENERLTRLWAEKQSLNILCIFCMFSVITAQGFNQSASGKRSPFEELTWIIINNIYGGIVNYFL